MGDGILIGVDTPSGLGRTPIEVDSLRSGSRLFVVHGDLRAESVQVGGMRPLQRLGHLAVEVLAAMAGQPAYITSWILWWVKA